MHRRIFRSVVVAVFVLLAAGISATSVAEDAGQLPRDPNNVYGQFDNGLKYIVRKNANPPGKVALYLHVKTGALNESDQQNGLAHFIEHMAFKGSAHFEPGKLIPLLTHLGMTFGADTNAHTNLRETVFKLTMPDTKPETIDKALTIFSDYASALTLAPVQIESERRVILEESRSRKSPEQRLRRAETKELFAGTSLAVHDIIGDEEQIKTFNQSTFQDYWNTWYRPEDMTLIVVGDIDPQAVIAQSKEKLSGFKARADKREPLKIGLKPFDSARAIIVTDPEKVSGEVNLVSLKAGRPPLTTYDQYRQETLEGVSEWIVNRRISDRITKGNAPFREANVGSNRMTPEGFLVEASAEGEPQDWNKMLDAVVEEVSRAIDHGFTQHELDLAKREMISSAEYAVKTEPTADARQVVNTLASEVGLDRPIMSAQQDLDLTKKAMAQITTDALHKAFVENFKTKNYAYVLAMPEGKEGLKLPDKDEVLAAAAAAWSKKTTAPEEVAEARSILASEPTPGKVATQEMDKDLDLTTVVFENGVVLHHKFSDYKKDQALVQITLPGGAIEETAANKGVSIAASLMLAHPATSRQTSTQIRDLLTGRNVSVGGAIGLDALTIHVSGSRQDLPQGMELGCALLTDGRLEQSALDDWKKNELQALIRKKTMAQGQIADAIAATILGDDIRFAPLTEETVNQQERSAAEAWFKRIAGNAAIEVAVTGDIPTNDAIDLVAKYIGSLPKRTDDFRALDGLRKIDRRPGPYAKTVHFKGVTPKAAVVSGYIGCDELDPDRRPLSLASLILSDRMIERIRIKEQLVYSIRCQSTPGKGLPGIGMLMSSAPTDPQNADKLTDTVQEMLKTFADKGPSEDELTTAKKQIANMLVSQMKEPEFWLAQFGDMSYRRRPLSDIKQLPGIFQTFSTDQVRDAVRKCAQESRGIRIEAIPDVGATAASGAPEATPAKGQSRPGADE